MSRVQARYIEELQVPLRPICESMTPHTPTAARETITLESMEVTVTHVNTDFDAFVSMLATRCLYLGAVIASSGSLNRNVWDLYRLHAEELDISEHARIEPDAVSRLIVVETVNAERLGDFEPIARSADAELAVFDHHEGDYPDWAPCESVVLSEDGALTTTMVSILAKPEIAGVLGWGAHRQAASAIHQGSLADARDRVLAAFSGAVDRHLTALDTMSKPPRFVGASDAVSHALVICQRHRQSGVHVGDTDALIGIVARKDLDKTVANGLPYAPVKSTLGPDLATCSFPVPIAELQRLLARLNVGRLLAVEDGTVIDVVTCGDLLHALEVPVGPADNLAW